MADLQLHITGALGLLLGVCLAAGVFADQLHLPKVTAYFLVGLLFFSVHGTSNGFKTKPTTVYRWCRDANHTSCWEWFAEATLCTR